MSTFVSELAADLEAFLAFKRSLGYRYLRAEFTLRDFDRFVSEQSQEKGVVRLDDAILAWLATKQGRKAVSVTNELGVLRQFCLHRRRRHPTTPVPGRVWAPQSTQSKFFPCVLTDAQVLDLVRRATLLDHPRFRGAAFRALLLVLYCTGVRFGEALRLRMGDVDMDRKLLFIAESKGRSRWVPFDPSLARELTRYMTARRAHAPAEPDDRFFVGADRRRLPTNTAWHTISGLFRAAGLKPPRGRIGPRPYDFRHTFAVHRLLRWYRAGVDINSRLPWLSAYMGHDNLLGTERYLTATPELMVTASRRFQRLLARRRHDP